MSNTKRKSKWMGFWIFCLVFALLVAGLTVYALGRVEDALIELQAKNDAKDNARPELARDAYLAELNGDYVAQRLDALYAQVDSRVQSQAQCEAIVKQALSQGIGYKVSFTSKDKQSFVLYDLAEENGKHRQIGEFSITPQGAGSHGFIPWAKADEYFNMDYLLQDGKSVTVPQGYSVWVNGNMLGADCIVKEGIGYESLKTMPQDLPLPTKVTYSYGTTLGPVAMEIRSPEGETVVIDENTDWNVFLPQCEAEQESLATGFVKEFLGHYVRFTSTKENVWDNYYKVVGYIVPDSELQQRLYKATDGLQWNATPADKLLDTTINRILPLSDGRYICDLTYHVQVHGRNGVTEQYTNVYIVLVERKGELKVESITLY